MEKGEAVVDVAKRASTAERVAWRSLRIISWMHVAWTWAMSAYAS